MNDNEALLQAKLSIIARDFSECYDALLDAKSRNVVLAAKVAELEAKLTPEEG